MRVYISGPMTGLPDHNYRAFDLAFGELSAAGYHPVSPADIGRAILKGNKDATWSDFLRQDIAALVTCDVILLLPGWEQSRGARLELHIADALGIRDVKTIEEIEAL